jgi:hypothetical protein
MNSKTDELLEIPNKKAESNRTNFQQSKHDSEVDEFARLDDLSDHIEQIQKQTGAIYTEKNPQQTSKVKNDSGHDDQNKLTKQIDAKTSTVTEKKVTKADHQGVSTPSPRVIQKENPSASREMTNPGHGEVFKQAVEARKKLNLQAKERQEPLSKRNKRVRTFIKTAVGVVSVILVWVVSLILKEPQEQKESADDNQIARNLIEPKIEEQSTKEIPATVNDRKQNLTNKSTSQSSEEKVDSLANINLDRLIGIQHSKEDVQKAVQRSKLKDALKKKSKDRE